MMKKSDDTPDNTKLRIDKWLWAARFFKTRPLAADAVECGKVLVNETRAKPAKTIAPGDTLSIRLGPYLFEVEVLALSDKRGPAPQAQKLYRETEAGRVKREALAAEIRAQPQPSELKGRPTKRDRRDIERFKVGSW
ncbi:MAG: RNA-binding S4 domain-containing protein [Gallionellaceae bacterium]|nr:MAG: RNA-binding S4 domain-containing protein [Gallionellaceae bacterium]